MGEYKVGIRRVSRTLHAVIGIFISASTAFAETTTISNSDSVTADNSCIERPFFMPVFGIVTDITVEVNIDHASRKQIDLYLISPEATTVELSTGNGRNKDNLYVNFDDSAATSIVDDKADHTTTVARQPEQLLSAFDGEDPYGTWTLRFCDTSTLLFNSEGTFNHATLNIVYDIPLDSDGDGVYDRSDMDSDNDGILDTEERIMDFSDTSNVFQTNGAASHVSANEIRVTSDIESQKGSAISLRPVSLNSSFFIDAELYLGAVDGADGMTFVLHNDPRGPGTIYDSAGSSMAALGGIADGISIEFDTYMSEEGSDDPSEDHTQIRDTDFEYNDPNLPSGVGCPKRNTLLYDRRDQSRELYR